MRARKQCQQLRTCTTSESAEIVTSDFTNSIVKWEPCDWEMAEGWTEGIPILFLGFLAQTIISLYLQLKA